MTTREIIRNANRAAHRAQWEWIRQLGMFRYIFIHGLVLQGLPMFSLMILFVFVFGGGQLLQSPPSIKIVLFAACLCFFPGVLYAWTTWRSSEREFRKVSDGFDGAESAKA